MFLLISGGHIGAPKLYTDMAFPYNALQRCVKTFRQITHSETVGHKDLRLGQIVYILVFYNISFSWLLPVDGFQFIFLLRDGENDLQFKGFNTTIKKMLNVAVNKIQDIQVLTAASCVPSLRSVVRGCSPRSPKLHC